jgi:3-oxoacyl-[acyl-carrier protein] reductase
LIDLAKSIGEREAIPEEEVTRRWTASIPLGRLGEPEEFGALVAFLCSERASYITGTCIQVDGGFVRTPI